MDPRRTPLAETPEKEPEAEAPNKETPGDQEPVPLNRQSGRMPVIIVSVLALAILGGAATGYAWLRFRSASPNLSSFAKLLPHETASVLIPKPSVPIRTASVPEPTAPVPIPAAPVPIPDPAVSATLKDIQSSQTQHSAALVAVLQRQSATLKQGAGTLESLKQGFTDQQADLKRISNQLSSLVARVDSLQNELPPLTTSSIPKPTARAPLVGTSRKKTSALSKPAGPAVLPKPVGPVSVGGAPLSPSPAPGSKAG
jgi:uncharacterized coiled-coil protein SlyX